MKETYKMQADSLMLLGAEYIAAKEAKAVAELRLIEAETKYLNAFEIVSCAHHDSDESKP